MSRRLHILRRFALLFGALAWVSGWGASLVHQSLTLHVTCEAHGDRVDVDNHHGAASASAAEGDVVRSLDALDAHDHDCGLQALGVARVAKVSVPKAFAQRVGRHDDPVPAIRAPRGPPLAYAPKTSPPSV